MPDNAQLCDLIISGLPVALFVVDREYKIIEFNEAAELITGWHKEEVLGHKCSDIFCSSLCRDQCPLRESAGKGVLCQGRQAVIRVKDNEELPILFSSRAIIDDVGRFICGVEVFRDATDILNLEAHKRNLISLFAHDLKSPVAITGGFVNRLLSGKAGILNEKQTQYLQTIQKETSRLEQYILSFLEIAKIEAGQIELQLAPCDMEQLLKEIITAFEVRAAEKKIDLEMDISSLSCPILVDRLQITRVLSNLLDNAIKYSDESSTVRISAADADGKFTLEIRDHGPGISSQDQAHIFDHFYRIDNTRRTVKGTGLGLAAVKAIVEAHGGKVSLQSRLGDGSSFSVIIPTTGEKEKE